MKIILSLLVVTGLITSSTVGVHESERSRAKKPVLSAAALKNTATVEKELHDLHAQLQQENRIMHRYKGWMWLGITLFSFGCTAALGCVAVTYVVFQMAINVIGTAAWMTMLTVAGGMVPDPIYLSASSSPLVMASAGVSIGLFIFSIYAFYKACTHLARGYRRPKKRYA